LLEQVQPAFVLQLQNRLTAPPTLIVDSAAELSLAAIAAEFSVSAASEAAITDALEIWTLASLLAASKAAGSRVKSVPACCVNGGRAAAVVDAAATLTDEAVAEDVAAATAVAVEPAAAVLPAAFPPLPPAAWPFLPPAWPWRPFGSGWAARRTTRFILPPLYESSAGERRDQPTARPSAPVSARPRDGKREKRARAIGRKCVGFIFSMLE
jgi:hypothetical protein